MFSNMDIDHMDTFKLAEVESLIWAEAHESITLRVTQNREVADNTLPYIPGR